MIVTFLIGGGSDGGGGGINGGDRHGKHSDKRGREGRGEQRIEDKRYVEEEEE